MKSGIDKLIDAAGGRPQLAKALGIKPQSIHQFYQRGWLPLKRAWQAHALYPAVPLIELVKPEIAEAMDAANPSA